MDDGLKQRIVGAFVLVALGVVFVPVVFDRERIEALDRTTQIPPAPHIEPIEIQLPVEKTPKEPLVKASEMFAPDEAKKDSVKVVEAEPVLNTMGTPNSWVLQIASYRFEGHAKQRRDALKKEGYVAYIKSIETAKGTMHRLYVGPYLSKTAGIKDKREIDEVLGVKSILLKFEP